MTSPFAEFARRVSNELDARPARRDRRRCATPQASGASLGESSDPGPSYACALSNQIQFCRDLVLLVLTRILTLRRH